MLVHSVSKSTGNSPVENDFLANVESINRHRSPTTAFSDLFSKTLASADQ